MGVIYAAQSRDLSAKLVEAKLINADQFLVKIGCADNFWYRAKAINGLCKLNPTWQHLNRSDWKFVRYRGHAWWSKLTLGEDEKSVLANFRDHNIKNMQSIDSNVLIQTLGYVPQELFLGDVNFTKCLESKLKQSASDAFASYFHNSFVQDEFETAVK